ncbi:MAG: hypothetical protein IPM46_02710 [Flavobacteriales bacterium]|nr:hypothetical protein [Flavobacteriales bacterium]
MQRDTTIATLHRLEPDYLEVRYKPGCVLNTSGVTEVAHARRELMGERPYGMLSIIPEDADFDTSAMSVDHLAKDRAEGHLLAIAVVTRANMIEMVIKLYFSYYPWLNRIHVTEDERGARAWMEKQMQELRGAVRGTPAR